LRNTQIKKTSNDTGKEMLMGLPSAGAPAGEEQEVVEQMAEGVEKEQEVGGKLETDDAGAVVQPCKHLRSRLG
jgi:hypothetical protein